jgi:hypothetical protein
MTPIDAQAAKLVEDMVAKGLANAGIEKHLAGFGLKSAALVSVGTSAAMDLVPKMTTAVFDGFKGIFHRKAAKKEESAAIKQVKALELRLAEMDKRLAAQVHTPASGSLKARNTEVRASQVANARKHHAHLSI